MTRIDVAVIGAGVTGLAAARALASRGLSTCVLERHPRPGLDTSTHNSGVIHAGIYYPAGSLKARLCVQGRHMLYQFCDAHHVPHRRSGKMIVASDHHEVPALEALWVRGLENGVEGLTIVDAQGLTAIEAHVRGAAALISPETGIVDTDALVRALLGSGQAAGAMFLPDTKLDAATRSRDGIVLRTARETILASQVVNAAGLYADTVSELLGGERFTIYPCRGEYAELAPARRTLVRAPVYPLPHGYGLGVHFVPTVGGAVWLGPTARYQDLKEDYERDRLPVEAFLASAARLVPSLTRADLRLSGSGIRAKLHGPDENVADFLVRRDKENPAVIQAAGIDSPGLTSCLAIGELVAQIAADL